MKVDTMSVTGRSITIMPEECALLIRHDGSQQHTDEIARFLEAPWRLGVKLSGEYKLDPRDVLYIYPAANDVMGVTATGRMVHYTEAEFDLLMADSAGSA